MCFKSILLLLALLSFSDLRPLSGQRTANQTLNFPTVITTGEYQVEEILKTNAILAISSPANGSGHVYLAERQGRISVVSDLASGTIPDTAFLDISSRVTTNSENGLLGLAFHPQYVSNGYFYLFYTTQASGRPTTRLSRFTRSNSNPLQADPNSELILLDQHDQAANHNGGAIHFGLDGYLYVGVGDEGGGGDSYQNGQRIDRDFFSGLLRLDVDKRAGNIEPTGHAAISRDSENRAPFSIPLDNPLVASWQATGANPDSKLRLEFFAIGLRNPWHFDIDPLTGQIWLSDVGQNSYEEINLIVKGGNYGWPNREGAHDYSQNRTIPPEFGPMIDPIFEYGRDLGSSVSGGIVYRGAEFPELYGAYLFSDFYQHHLWATNWDATTSSYQTKRIGSITNASAYGRDPISGELLAGSIRGGLGQLKRSATSNQLEFPENLSATGAFSNIETLTAESGIYAYEPAMPFWSDHAIKTRWVAIPADQQVSYSENDPWTIPPGSIWIKHFELESERGNPSKRKRIETRFLVKIENGIYGLSYQWNEAQTEATLVPSEGASIEFPVTIDGQQSIQNWQIPSRQQCLSCHTPTAGYALSFNTRQLNKLGEHEGEIENTLAYFSRLGILDTEISNPETLPVHYLPDDTTASLEARARSYLAVNCISCHQPNGGTPTSWDARPHISLDETGLIDGEASENGGNPEKKLIVSGSPELSIILDRLAARNGFTRMPPFGNSMTDETGLDLLTEWIAKRGTDTQFRQWQILHFSSATVPEAAPEADPDLDGNSNRLEFLNRTLPLDPHSNWKPQFTRDQDELSVRFAMAPGRNFVIQKSTDLSTWTDWQTSGNPPETDPVQEAEALIKGSLDGAEANNFFRIKVEE